MPLTAPQEAAVVIAAKSAVAEMPKRTSLPSMLPPDWAADAAWSTPDDANAGLPACSKVIAPAAANVNITVIAASTAQPCRVSPTRRPNA